MYFERLVLEIQSNNAGWKTVKPPFVDGISGIAHKFSFLATDDACTYGFDIYNNVSEEEVLRTYMKSGRPKMEVARLADQYGITILGPGDIEQFFSMDSIEQRSAQRPLAKVSE
jgi:hypothetical protein